MEIVKIEVARPECGHSLTVVSAVAHLDIDLSDLLPYLNATQEKARYFPKNPYLRFTWQGHTVVIEQDQVRVSPFADDREAIKGAERVIDLIREIKSRKDTIAPDHTAFAPPSIMELFKLLPKKSGCTNCGYQTCMAFAAALVGEKAGLEACTEFNRDSGTEKNLGKLKELLGLSG